MKGDADFENHCSAGKICIERYEDYPQLGRFTLRDQVSYSQIGSNREAN